MDLRLRIHKPLVDRFSRYEYDSRALAKQLCQSFIAEKWIAWNKLQLKRGPHL